MRDRCRRRRLVWPNGAVAQGFSAEDPESLRGPQFGAAWADEVGKWRQADATFASNIGSYKVDATSLSAFAGTNVGNFFVRGMASVSDLSYDSIRRNVVLGPVTRVASGGTSGGNFSTSLAVGASTHELVAR